MFKFHSLAALQHVKNNPRTKAQSDLLKGQVVVVDEVAGTAKAPATTSEAEGAFHVVNNIIDKPEVRNSADFKVERDEYVKADFLTDANHLLAELSDDVLVDAYSGLAQNDVLVPAGDGSGNWVFADGTNIVASNYKVNLSIVEKTTLGGNGLLVKITIN